MQLAAGSYSTASTPAASILAKVVAVYETLRYAYVRPWRRMCCVGAVVAEVSCCSRRVCLYVGMECVYMWVWSVSICGYGVCLYVGMECVYMWVWRCMYKSVCGRECVRVVHLAACGRMFRLS
jgi:hypothetical protein